MHSPLLSVEGLCGFLPSGSIKIQVHAGSCTGFSDFQSDSPGIASSSSASSFDVIAPLSSHGSFRISDASPPIASSAGIQSGSGLLKSVVMKNSDDQHQTRKHPSSSKPSSSLASSASSSGETKTKTKDTERDHRLRSPVSEPVIGYSAFEEKKLAKSSYDSDAIWGDTHWAVGGGGGGGVSVGTYDYDFEDHDDSDNINNNNDDKNSYDYLTAVPPLTRIINVGGRGGGGGGGRSGGGGRGGGGGGYIQRGKTEMEVTQEWHIATRIVVEEICASEIQL